MLEQKQQLPQQEWAQKHYRLPIVLIPLGKCHNPAIGGIGKGHLVKNKRNGRNNALAADYSYTHAYTNAKACCAINQSASRSAIISLRY